MQLFFPLIIAVIGWCVGALVIIIVDGLYWRRGALSETCRSAIQKNSWLVYAIWPLAQNDCERKIPIRNLLVKILFAGLVIWLWERPIAGISIYWMIPLLVYFTVVTIMDLEHRVVMHEVSWAGAVLGLLFGVIRRGWLSTVLGGLVGFGLMYLGYILGALYIRLRSKMRGEEITEVALGFGDVNVSGVIGLILGWPGIMGGLVVGVLLGGLGSGMYFLYRLISKTQQEFEAVPYAPFLVLGALFLIFFRSIY
jgi:prepilin signal peptidase PulO-like enzyme (type II secretory pathway)